MSPQSDSASKSQQDLDELVERDPELAVQSLRDKLSGDPLDASGYHMLARALAAREARASVTGEVRTVVSGIDNQVARAASALNAGDLETAEIILRRRLLERPADIAALHQMARFAAELGYDEECQDLLQLVMQLAPDFAQARIDYAAGLEKQNRLLEAAQALEPVLAAEPNHVAAKALRASALWRAGRLDEARQLYEDLLPAVPREPALWTSYGNVLRGLGESDLAQKAIRTAISVAPRSGDAWWSLANLKTVRLNDQDIAAMRSALEQPDLGDEDRLQIHFALGKALEDSGEYAQSFDNYDRANAIRRQGMDHGADALDSTIDASISVFSRDFFAERTGFGSPARDPIFVVGLPRSGSTLIEQILASHPQIEGTSELPNLPMISREIGRGASEFFSNVAGLTAEDAASWGESYIERTRAYRLSDRPFFVDKMPNNWLHIPLIHLILPNAKIIDARRHPLACGFSNFKQSYVGGHLFSYGLESIGNYYAKYVRLMDHVDEVLPGRVHRVFHERLVEDTEREVRLMLDYLELAFDPACLRFYENERTVRTVSSEQVRRPISREGLEQWRAYEQWLGPLKQALGPVLDAYPEPNLVAPKTVLPTER